jgi:hypothetical protein
MVKRVKRVKRVERSKKPPSRARALHRDFAVVLEALRGDFRVFGDALQSFREEVDARFQQVDARFQQVDTRFQQVDARFDQVDARFQQVNAHFDRVDTDIGLLKSAVVENTRELKRIGTALDRKVDRDEVEALVERVVRRGE